MVNDMNKTTFSLEIFGERAACMEYFSGSDNSAYLKYLKGCLMEAIDGVLTEKQREAVIGVYFENRSVTEVANRLGVNRSTVSRNLRRALKSLSAALRFCRPYCQDDYN